MHDTWWIPLHLNPPRQCHYGQMNFKERQVLIIKMHLILRWVFAFQQNFVCIKPEVLNWQFWNFFPECAMCIYNEHFWDVLTGPSSMYYLLCMYYLYALTENTISMSKDIVPKLWELALHTLYWASLFCTTTFCIPTTFLPKKAGDRFLKLLA